MSENLMDQVPGAESMDRVLGAESMDKVPGAKSERSDAEFIEEIVVTDNRGMVHKFKGTAELMQWREDQNQDRNNP